MAKKVKKKIVKKRIVKAKKKIAKTKKKVIKKRAGKKVKTQIIGEVVHYFPHVQAGVIKLKKGNISLGETLYIKGHTTDLKQKVTSMQIDHVPIDEAKKGDEIGLLVKARVRQGDTVYKL